MIVININAPIFKVIKAHYIGSNSIRIDQNNRCDAVMTGTAQCWFWYLLTSVLVSSTVMQLSPAFALAVITSIEAYYSRYHNYGTCSVKAIA